MMSPSPYPVCRTLCLPQVPVVKQGDMVMPDSDKIVVWLEDQFPSPPMKGKAPEGL